MDVSEKNFEAAVEAALLRDPLASAPEATGKASPMSETANVGFLSGGFHRRTSEDYDRELCIIPQDVIGFSSATQPKEWQKMLTQHGAEAKPLLLKRLASEVTKHGTLHVLRKGVKANGCKFRLVYFRPVSGLNESARTLYQANQFAVVRQLRYSGKNEKSLDLAVF